MSEIIATAEKLESLAQLLLEPAAEIHYLHARVATLEAAAKAPPEASGQQPKAPRPRKLWGTARDVDDNAAIYTEVDMEALGRRCYLAGVKDGRGDGAQAEEDVWAAHRNGTGPRPGRLA